MDKNYKSTKGITLIALVITIIVLIILAGVSIAMLTGQNGILTKANESKTTNEEKTALEQMKLVLNEWQTEKHTGSQTLKKFLESKTPKTDANPNGTGELDAVTENGSFEIEKSGYTATVSEDGILNEDTISKVGPRPEVSDEKVVNSSGNILNAPSVDSGTIVYINFTATLENGAIDTVECDKGTPELTNGIWKTPVTENGIYTFTIKGKLTGETEVRTRTYTVTINQFAKTILEVKSSMAIGSYINYNVKYTDMYSDYEFTANDGWRVLDPGTDNKDGTYSGVKLISTGIPAKLYYYYSDIADAPWAGDGTNYNDKAANGLLNKFRSIVFKRASGSDKHNEGYYKSIDGQADGDLDTSRFIKVPGATVHNLTLEELNTARGKNATATTSTATSDAATGLFYLRGLGDKYNEYSSKSPYYWLASPRSDNAHNVWLVYFDGYFGGDDSNTYGVRPVVSLPSNVQIDIVGN